MSSRAKSPRRTPRRAAKEPPVSPTRLTRLEEKDQLKDLNKRLEYYILKQRERDANQGVAERELQSFKDNAAEELRNAEKLWSDQLAKVREERDEAVNEKCKLEAERNKEAKRNAHLQHELDNARESRDELHERVEQLTQEVSNKEIELLKATEDAKQIRSELATEKRRTEDLEQQLTEQDPVDEEDLAMQLATANGKIKNLEEDNNLLQKKYDSEVARLRDLIGDLTHKNAHIEEETRAEFAEQLEELLAERKQELELENEDALEALKKVYEEKLDAYRDHLERAGHELEEMRSKLQQAEEKENKAYTTANDITKEKQVLEERIQDLEEQIQNHEDRPHQQVAELKEIIRRIKASFKRKDKEFDDLMDVKIALAMEIKQYRQLLDKEEDRLGYNTPAKKRRKRKHDEDTLDTRDDSGEEKGEEEEEEEEQSIVFSGRDVHGEWFTIRNQSTEVVNVNGWQVQAENSGKFLDLTDTELRPGDSLTIYTGANASQVVQDQDVYDLAWDENGEDVFDPSGDVALLVSPDATVRSEMEIVPTQPDVTGDMDVDSEDGKPAPKREPGWFSTLFGWGKQNA